MLKSKIDIETLNLESEAELAEFEAIVDRVGSEAGAEAEAATEALRMKAPIPAK